MLIVILNDDLLVIELDFQLLQQSVTYNDSLVACDNATSSASVVDVVTNVCFDARYPISLPNSFIAYACDDFLSTVLSANDASLTT